MGCGCYAGSAAAVGTAAAMDDDVTVLSKGSRLWYQSDDNNWEQGELLSVDGATASIRLEASGQTLSGVALKKIVPANPVMQQAIDDLTQLSYLNEPSILGNLSV